MKEEKRKANSGLTTRSDTPRESSRGINTHGGCARKVKLWGVSAENRWFYPRWVHRASAERERSPPSFPTDTARLQSVTGNLSDLTPRCTGQVRLTCVGVASHWQPPALSRSNSWCWVRRRYLLSPSTYWLCVSGRTVWCQFPRSCWLSIVNRDSLLSPVGSSTGLLSTVGLFAPLPPHRLHLPSQQRESFWKANRLF